ncbi:chemotaxis protein CheB [Spirosoma sp. SC4-14]|uniref:chemotaxis protein CheB n=1 Tax=Spirosoma sp. SC4-14 TaxID=3128900 RepID=UPI0030D0CAAA
MAKDELKTTYKAVVIGGSTGSLDVLLRILPALQPAMPFTVIIVLHRKNSGDSTLEHLLAGKTSIPVKEVDDKEPLLPAHIYVAPADYHLLIENDFTVSLDDSEKVNYSRPALDVTFESAADVYRNTLVGILLSGANADGTKGLAAIKRMGGITVVQNPSTAQAAFMPQQAILNTTIDHILDIPELIQFINSIRHR